MVLALAVWLTDVSPSPVPEYTGDVNLVTPGVIGFIVTFLIAVATVLLVIDMTRRIRRVRYRAEVQEQLAAEAATANGSASKTGPAPEASSAPNASPAPED